MTSSSFYWASFTFSWHFAKPSLKASHNFLPCPRVRSCSKLFEKRRGKGKVKRTQGNVTGNGRVCRSSYFCVFFFWYSSKRARRTPFSAMSLFPCLQMCGKQTGKEAGGHGSGASPDARKRGVVTVPKRKGSIWRQRA